MRDEKGDEAGQEALLRPEEEHVSGERGDETGEDRARIGVAAAATRGMSDDEERRQRFRHRRQQPRPGLESDDGNDAAQRGERSKRVHGASFVWRAVIP